MTESQRPTKRRQSPLRLRPPPFIALGFVLGPTAGLTVFWVLLLIDMMFEPGRGMAGVSGVALLFYYVFLVIFGVAACLVVELVLITPLLIAFHRHRWAWLDARTGGLIGFALAFAAGFLLLGVLARPAHQVDWGVVTVAAGRRTPLGWALTLGACAAIGVVGLVAAGVFRLIAVQRADDAEGART